MDTLPIYDFSQLGHQWTDILANDYFKCATDAFNLDKKCVYGKILIFEIIFNFQFCFSELIQTLSLVHKR